MSFPEFEKLVEVVARLRKECPWDKVQTHQSLTRYLLEEAHEAVEAVETGSLENFREELGDVLLQVVLHSEIANETGLFDIEKVSKGISEKMIRRHPHVFGDVQARDEGHVKLNWEKIKAEERSSKKKESGVLSGVPVSMPALVVSQRYGEKASSVGFDWSSALEVWKKVREEVGEVEAELQKLPADARGPEAVAAAQEELGDLFFVLANFARHLGLDAEAAAKQGARKFAARLGKIEKRVAGEGKALSDFSAEELEVLWNDAKKS